MRKGARILAARIAHALFAAQREPADLEKASALIEEAMSLSPQDPAPLREAFRIALTGNRTAKAEMYLERLEELTPKDPEILPLAAELAERRGRTEEAEELLVKAIEQAPTTWQYRDRLAVLLAGQGRIDEARLQIDTILKQDSNNVWAQERLGNLELSYGDPERAEQIYRGLLKHSPERILGNLATALELRGRSREAADFYRRALKARPGQVAAIINLAEVEKDLGHDSEAAELYDRALSRLQVIEEGAAGLSISEALWKAQCLARLGRTREAITITRRKSDKITDEPYLLLRSALIYSLAGDRAAALDAAEAALDNGLPQRWFAGSTFRWLRESQELRSRFHLDAASL
jgi:tetratricopeptide (TPR) repeat protein